MVNEPNINEVNTIFIITSRNAYLNFVLYIENNVIILANPIFIPGIYGNNDAIIITADHGCDPATESTDHSREYTPAIIFGKKIKNGEYGTRKSFSDIAATVADMLEIEYGASGESFAKNITNEEKK